MDPKQFAEFRHEAVHGLMKLNQNCDEEFQIPSWPKWEYDLDRKTLAFSKEGVSKVIASIEVVGTTSITGGTWLWGWANKNLPENATNAVAKVRTFGEVENVAELTRASSPDNEYLGWEMTAIAAKVLGAKGAYRCPGENGFLYLVYTCIRFAADKKETRNAFEQIECTTHGSGLQAYVCEHLISNPEQEWFSADPDEESKWPDAWCAACDVYFQQEGEWNNKNESNIKIKLLCHHCYERLRSHEQPGRR